eukprot:CAMPEP_0202088328 /NCGR_PEP_ID=MMETSP0964-20121228/38357_1 /ASSEMBLY_ACC=CAM_ASM_000500 /TAXON_ID=4773 /ORGANISM="Schizochytrium aggregatum, Strain ATCC28209" /LENGTH=101 /DNA_ID=CAMNT_0048656337 /DNA_START=176 /DNA_END=478 /DNA_ORIENTATION=-
MGAPTQSALSRCCASRPARPDPALAAALTGHRVHEPLRIAAVDRVALRLHQKTDVKSSRPPETAQSGRQDAAARTSQRARAQRTRGGAGLAGEGGAPGPLR